MPSVTHSTVSSREVVVADKAKQRRPQFRSVQPSVTHKTPEDLFYKLARKQTHGYLRGPQQDVLREYAENHTKLQM